MTHIPKRRCVGCMTSYDKSSLFRIVRAADGEVVVDKSHKCNGRGTYLCKNKECIENAQKRKQLQRGLKGAVSDEFYHKLMEEVENNE